MRFYVAGIGNHPIGTFLTVGVLGTGLTEARHPHVGGLWGLALDAHVLGNSRVEGVLGIACVIFTRLALFRLHEYERAVDIGIEG